MSSIAKQLTGIIQKLAERMESAVAVRLEHFKFAPWFAFSLLVYCVCARVGVYLCARLCVRVRGQVGGDFFDGVQKLEACHKGHFPFFHWLCRSKRL